MDGEKKPAVSPRNGQPVPTNLAGRPRGVPNKATMKFKEALNNLFELAADDMVQWLAEVKDPKDRFDILAKFADYLFPKLARHESKVEIEQTVTHKNLTVQQLDKWIEGTVTGKQVSDNAPVVPH